MFCGTILVFKGLAIAKYYKEYQFRELGDIDFYIDYSNFKKAHFLLRETIGRKAAFFLTRSTLPSGKGLLSLRYWCGFTYDFS